MVTENYCFVVDGEKLTATDLVEDTNWWRPTGRPTKYYYSADLKTFQRVNIILVKGRVISARLCQTRTTPPAVSHQGLGSSISDPHRPPTSLSTTSGRSFSVSSAGGPLRRSSFSFHSPPPSSTAAGPFSSSTSSSPGHFYTGGPIRWTRYQQHRHSSTATTSGATLASGPIHRPTSMASISAATSPLAPGPQPPQQPSPVGRFLQHYHTFHHLQAPPLPGPPLPVHHEPRATAEVPLDCVYKVTRFYSFWKTCTSFHRIVTLITPLTEPHSNPQYKRRMFVQYLWRNAKEADKQRVQREFDPQKAKLFSKMKQRNPLDRKRTFHF